MSEFELIRHAPRARFLRVWDDLIAISDREDDARLIEVLAYEMSRELRALDDEAREVEVALLEGQLTVLEGLSVKALAGEHAQRLHASSAWVRRSHSELAERIGRSRPSVMASIKRLCERGFLLQAQTPEPTDQARLYLLNLRVLHEAIDEYASIRTPGAKVKTLTVESQSVDAGVGMALQAPVKTLPGPGQDFDSPLSKDCLSIDRPEMDKTSKTGETARSLSFYDDLGVSQKTLREAAIPKRLLGVRLDELAGEDLSYARAVALAEEWAAGKSPHLLILGGPARGKTTIAAAAAIAALRNRRAVRWLLASALPRALSADWGDAQRKEAVAALGGKGGLILDDLEYLADRRARREVETAITARVQAGALLLITSPLSPAELADEKDGVGERLASRILDSFGCIELSGPNMTELRLAS